MICSDGSLVKVESRTHPFIYCTQPHPHLPVLATSGIETVVRLWSPPRDAEEAAAPVAAGTVPGQEEQSLPGGLVARNQERMREGPQLLRGVNPRILQVRACSSASPEKCSGLHWSAMTLRVNWRKEPASQTGD